MPDPRVANCMFCVDIRAEVGNKTSLMGVYGGDIYFSTPLPILVPRFAVGVWLIADIDDTIQSMAVRILVPPNQIEIMRATIPVQQGIAHQEGATKFHTFAAIPFQMPPTSVGMCSIKMYWSGHSQYSREPGCHLRVAMTKSYALDFAIWRSIIRNVASKARSERTRRMNNIVPANPPVA